MATPDRVTLEQGSGDAGVEDRVPGRDLSRELDEWDDGKGGEERTGGEEGSRCASVRKKYHLHRTTPDAATEGMKSLSSDIIHKPWDKFTYLYTCMYMYVCIYIATVLYAHFPCKFTPYNQVPLISPYNYLHAWVYLITIQYSYNLQSFNSPLTKGDYIMFNLLYDIPLYLMSLSVF